MTPYHHILEDCHVKKYLEILKGTGNAELCYLEGFEPGKVMAIKGDGTGSWGVDTGKKVKEGGLACTIWPDYGKDYLWINLEIKPCNGSDAAKFFFKSGNRKKAHCVLISLFFNQPVTMRLPDTNRPSGRNIMIIMRMAP